MMKRTSLRDQAVASGASLRFSAMCATFALLACGGCERPIDPSTRSAGEETPAADSSPREELEGEVELEDSEMLKLELSEGETEADEVDRPPTAVAEPLSDSDTRQLLARLPDLVDPHEGEELALPPDSRPPPRPGETVTDAFPPPGEVDRPEDVEEGPLKVARYAPEGDVPLAPHVSITFNQPMVPVTSHAQAAADVPVRLSPELEGKWRWVGTRTLLFELDGRLPMATSFEATIPAGTRSAVGVELDEAHQWTFRTPPPSIESFWPASRTPQRRDTVMVIVFDQKVNPEAILDHLVVEAGGERQAVVKATDEDLEEFPQAKSLAGAAEEGRWVAFRPSRPMPYDSTVSVVLPEGTPSAEGPRVTEDSQQRTFKTYGPFRVTGSRCHGECSPGTAWTITFSNPIDLDVFDGEAHIEIEPELELPRFAPHGRHLSINGLQEANTRYEVRLSEELKDVFGQTLEEADPITFSVGPTTPRFTSMPGSMVVLDPSAPPELEIHTQGFTHLDVTAHAVEPQHWQPAQRWQRYQKEEQPGTPAFERRNPVEGEPDEMSTTPIDLSEALEADHGHVLLRVRGYPRPKSRWRQPEIRVWVQRTRLGLMAWNAESLDVLVMGLDSGEPIEGASLSLLDSEGSDLGVQASTDEQGVGTVPLADLAASLLVATSGDDVALLSPGGRRWMGGTWTKSVPSDRLLWYVTDDRKMYKPGERPHFKGWVRVARAGPEGDIEEPARAGKVSWRALDPRGGELARGETDMDSDGGFHLDFDIPEDTNLGHATLRLNTSMSGVSSSQSHRFQIQAFRRPEFEVDAKGSEAPHFLGEELTATVTAAYYTGEPLPGADVRWNVNSKPGTYRPPGHDRFTFGRSISPWGWRLPGTGRSSETDTQQLTGKTAADGTHVLELRPAGGPPFPMSVEAEARVTDIDRQSWAASAPFLIHPANLYVGLATERLFIGRGEDLDVELIVADLDGELMAERPVSIKGERLGWRRTSSGFEETIEETKTCEAVSAGEPVTCTLEEMEGGRWRITASVTDDRGRESKTVTVRWVSGGPPRPRVARVEQEEVTLIPDKEEYEPGDVASVLAQLPFHPADVVVTYRREGILETERLRIEDPDHTLELDIEDSITPGVHVHVAVAGTAPRLGPEGEPDETLPSRPAFGYGSLYLPVPPNARKLSVEAEPEVDELEPGGSTRVHVSVRDAEDNPVPHSQVLVVAVDEAILALTGHRLPDPLDSFYPKRSTGVGDTALYPSVLLADLDLDVDDLESGMEDAEKAGIGGYGARRMSRSRAAPAMEASADALAGAEAQPSAEPIAMRTDLTPLALFAPSVRTGAEGTAEVELDLPDNLTRYRIMAVATDGAQRFGGGESTVTARLPLMVRPSLPRFLNLGDETSLPFVVHNQTGDDITVSLAARSAGLDIEGSGGWRFPVPARDRVEVRLEANADRVGPAVVQVAGSSGSHADATELTLPVWTPVTSEAFATYGAVDEGAILQPVEAPEDARTDFGGLELTTSSTQLQALTDAVVYLWECEYTATEPIASRLIALSALLDVLEAFESDALPPKEEMEQAVALAVEILQRRQASHGGFGLWRRPARNELHWPYLTVHTTLALTMAREKGFEVPDQLLDRARGYLQNIERHIPGWYPRQTKWTIRAAALFVLERGGHTDGEKARALLSEAGVGKLNIEASGFLLPVLQADGRSGDEIAAIERHLTNLVTETAAGATFTTSYSDGAHLLFHSSRRTDAVILYGLMAARPSSDLIVKTVQGLLAHRVRGRWANTQENGWVLVALDRYFRQYEGETPSFVARAWLGERFAGEHRFEGRTTERHHVSVPMQWLAEREGRQDLTLAKEGTGRMYYRVGLRYVPEDLAPPPADHGFAVERVYEAVEDSDDVRREDDGTWRVRAGAMVRVRLTMVAPARRYHVALVDRLPAGFEPMNPALAVTGQVPADPEAATRSLGRFWFWWRTWYEHQNLRDERAEAFTPLLWAGVHSYSYVARATTPGRFIAPPPTAEEMYHPETFGRGAGEVVVVETDEEPVARN